jgi:hypothetical protein
MSWVVLHSDISDLLELVDPHNGLVTQVTKYDLLPIAFLKPPPLLQAKLSLTFHSCKYIIQDRYLIRSGNVYALHVFIAQLFHGFRPQIFR